MSKIEKLYQMVNGVIYRRDIPKEAKEFAKENNLIVIVGGSDDLMYAWGAESYLTDYEEHSYGWDGDTLQNISDKQLENEASQLGLMIYWCGVIEGTDFSKLDYSVDKQGAFSYSVNSNIKHKDFIVYEDDSKDEVYCTGIIIELPEDFVSHK